MTEAKKEYQKTKAKRVVINVTLEDFYRWSGYAAQRRMPLASCLRSLIEQAISDYEYDYDDNINHIVREELNL